ncbi:MAG: helix-hairpin-helix domain-containing protein, partial [Bacteroidota bacterium]
DSVPVYLDKKGETLRIIQQLRDEVHRFGITHHRNRRSKQFTGSELATIKGIGETTAMDLLRHFKSVKKVREAEMEELIQIIGNAKSKKNEVIFAIHFDLGIVPTCILTKLFEIVFV